MGRPKNIRKAIMILISNTNIKYTIYVSSNGMYGWSDALGYGGKYKTYELVLNHLITSKGC